ncbi:MAG: cobalamin-binding domain-containing protein [Negativicutes bacterium]
MRILLVEPAYKNKYPPLGLMKISTYHKHKGDEVLFCKGNNKKLQVEKWDRIYISTLFTFHWGITVKTIQYYAESVTDKGKIYVGGVMATLKADELENVFKKIVVIRGLLDKNGLLEYNDEACIDALIPDYSIINSTQNAYLNYVYPENDCYYIHASRGCIRKCPFCAVHVIEPEFKVTTSIIDQINHVKELYSEKRNLMIMDNNILALDNFPELVKEIIRAGFGRGAVFKNQNNKKVVRRVDFNQGVDARLLTEQNMEMISKIAISPLRIAFDDIELKNTYVEKVRLAAQYGIKILSNYILFNFKDTPENFYDRLLTNIELNEEFTASGLATAVWSFPMKYVPISGEFSINRKYVGEQWNKKLLRGLQCILIPTRGVVGKHRGYFEAAFGRNSKEFREIMMLPEEYILQRSKYINNGLRQEFATQKNALNCEQFREFEEIVSNNDFCIKSSDSSVDSLLDCYR